MYGLVVVLLIAFCMEERCTSKYLPISSILMKFASSIYDRKAAVHPNFNQGFWARFKTLTGVTGWQLASSGPSWKEVILAPINLLWRPHLVGIYTLLVGYFVNISIW